MTNKYYTAMRAVNTKQPVNIRLIAEYLKFIKQKKTPKYDKRRITSISNIS